MPRSECRSGAPRVEAIYRDTRKKSEEWIKKTWDEKPISQARFFSEINQRVQGKSWALVSSHGRRWREAIEVTEPAHGMGGGRGGGVGYGLPSSIGSALGFKGSGRLCVSILGDGDFLMTSNALWTAAKYQIPLLGDRAQQSLVLQRRGASGAHGALARSGRWRTKASASASKIRCRICAPSRARFSVDAFGPITEPGDLGPALDKAIAIVESGKPVVVDVFTQPR